MMYVLLLLLIVTLGLIPYILIDHAIAKRKAQAEVDRKNAEADRIREEGGICLIRYYVD